MSKKLSEVIPKVADAAATHSDIGDSAAELDAVRQQLLAEDGLEETAKETADVSDVLDAAPAKTSDEMTKEERSTAKAALLERETTIGTKTLQDGKIVVEKDGKRLDEQNIGKESKKLGGTITEKDGMYHYEGVLGKFDYDPDEWAIGTKELKDDDGVKTTMPILRFIDEDNAKLLTKALYGNNITVPDGVKSLDYSFEGIELLETVPVLPDSVETAHGAFKDCTGITRACKDAKNDEVNGNERKIGGVVGGSIITGATAGVAGGLMTGPGAVVTGVGGALVGAGVGIYSWVSGNDVDGRGGQWTMPKNLKDASYMFAGCDNLTEGYEAANDALMNARGMYKDNKNIGTDAYAVEKGSVSVTDFTDSKLSKEAVQDSFSGANNVVAKGLEENYSKDWDDTTKTLNKEDITDEEKQEVEQLSETLAMEDVRNGKVETDMSVLTDGLAYDAKVHTENGWKTTGNINDKNVGLQADGNSTGAFMDRALVSVGEFAILRLVTGNSLVSAAATFGLQTVGILPKSMKPVIDTVTGFVGEDSALGKGLTSLSNKLTGTVAASSAPDVVVDAQDAKEKDKLDTTLAAADARIVRSMEGSMRAAETSDIDITKAMSANGAAVAKDNIFLSLANKQANDEEFKNMQGLTTVTAAALEEKTIAMAGSDNTLSDAEKTQLSDLYVNLVQGLDAYDSSAMDTMQKEYAGNDAKLAQGTEGLSRVMMATTGPVFDSMLELNEKYDFLSEDAKTKLGTFEITGVSKFSEHTMGAYDVPDAAAALPTLPDGYTEDEALYANAGLFEEDAAVDATAENAASKPAKSITTEPVAATAGTKTKGTNEQRVAMVEHTFGDVLSKTEGASNEYVLE